MVKIFCVFWLKNIILLVKSNILEVDSQPSSVFSTFYLWLRYQTYRLWLEIFIQTNAHKICIVCVLYLADCLFNRVPILEKTEVTLVSELERGLISK